MDTLPDELLEYIFNFLSYVEQRKIRTVCKQFYKLLPNLEIKTRINKNLIKHIIPIKKDIKSQLDTKYHKDINILSMCVAGYILLFKNFKPVNVDTRCFIYKVFYHDNKLFLTSYFNLVYIVDTNDYKIIEQFYAPFDSRIIRMKFYDNNIIILTEDGIVSLAEYTAEDKIKINLMITQNHDVILINDMVYIFTINKQILVYKNCICINRIQTKNQTRYIAYFNKDFFITFNDKNIITKWNLKCEIIEEKILSIDVKHIYFTLDSYIILASDNKIYYKDKLIHCDGEKIMYYVDNYDNLVLIDRKNNNFIIL